MKLKYYLRGLGIGIVVTVCVLSAAFQNTEPMTDAQIKERAKELGMIESTVLSDMHNKEDETEQEVPEDVTEQLEVENEVVEQPENQPDEDTTAEIEPNEPEQKDDEENAVSVSVNVVRGDSSWSVSKRMEEAGLIDSASEFDSFLCKGGYDKRISIGNYEIPSGASFEEMAKIITKSN